MKIGQDLLKGLLNGIVKGAVAVMRWFSKLAGKVIKWIGNMAKTLFNKGKDLLQGLWDGVIKKAEAVALWFGNFEIKVLKWIGGLLRTLVQKGKDLLQGLWDGVIKKAEGLAKWFGEFAVKVVKWIGGLLATLVQSGKDLLQGLWNGAKDTFEFLKTWVMGLGSSLIGAIGDGLSILYDTGKDIMQGLWNGLTDLWDSVWAWVQDQINKIPKPIRKLLGLASPSKLFYYFGNMIMQGLANGLEDNAYRVDRASENMAKNLKDDMTSRLMKVSKDMERFEEFNPTITPVLDLTEIRASAKQIGDYIQGPQKIKPLFSYRQAQTIAATTKPTDSTTETPAGAGGVKFEQNIYAPAQLSTNDIYKQTRNQIKMAKEELKIA
jgi:phage-related protein